MALVIRPEMVDPIETARLAEEAFGGPAGTFRPERVAWLYDHAFSHSTDVLSLFAGDRKVGQVALVHQRVRIGDALLPAVALIDLFILKAFRSREAIASLYGEVERLCRARGVRFILAVPNGNAAGVNRRFLGLSDATRLEIRAGVAPPFGGRVAFSAAVRDIPAEAAQALFARYAPGGQDGLSWTSESLWARLQDPSAAYAVHATADLLLVSARRVLRRVPHTLLCAFLPRPGSRPARGDARAVTAAACRLHRRPLFVYAGVNSGLPLPGWSLPERLRPSQMMLQIRDFAEPEAPVRFGRFELLDFDFA